MSDEQTTVIDVADIDTELTPEQQSRAAGDAIWGLLENARVSKASDLATDATAKADRQLYRGIVQSIRNAAKDCGAKKIKTDQGIEAAIEAVVAEHGRTYGTGGLAGRLLGLVTVAVSANGDTMAGGHTPRAVAMAVAGITDTYKDIAGF